MVVVQDKNAFIGITTRCEESICCPYTYIQLVLGQKKKKQSSDFARVDLLGIQWNGLLPPELKPGLIRYLTKISLYLSHDVALLLDTQGMFSLYRDCGSQVSKSHSTHFWNYC